MDTFKDIHSGYNFCIKTGNECSDHMINNGIFEYDLIKWCEQFLTPVGTFVDIGAHIGTYSVILSKKCKQVYSFEPQKDTFDCLNISIINNDCLNVKCYNVALGSKEDKAILHHVSEDGGGSTLREDTPLNTINTEQVSISTLDSFNISNIEFMKIDVEGYELKVIKGAKQTLEKNSYPPFIFEAWPDEWYKEDRNKLIEYVNNIGYQVILILGTDNMYLACNHESKRPKQEEWEKILIKVKHNRIIGEHKLAYDLATKGLSLIPDSKRYLLLYEVSIVAYYLGLLEEGYEACESILLSDLVPWSIKNSTLSNQGFYMSRLPVRKIICIQLDNTILREYKESSTAIIPNGNGYKCNIRLVNYSINEQGGYDIKDKNNIVRTRNILAIMDNTLTINSTVELQDKSGIKLYPSNILGVEDIRLFGENQFFCTYLEVNSSRTPQVCYGEYNSLTGHIIKIIPLSMTLQLQCEKNWMPFINNEEIYFIYSMNPFTLCHLNSGNGNITVINTNYRSGNYDFRGSSNLIPYKQGWLCTVHQVCYSSPRKYFHRFIWFDKDFTCMKYSKVFYFTSVGIEYNLSICHSEDGLLVPYSEKDNTSKIAIIDYIVIDEYLSL